jgi:hypothetical protein
VTHGTPWGYSNGCRDSQECPNWRRALTTCSDARSQYLARYFAQRRSGEGRPFPHGTSNGYVMGCRNRQECPGSDNGGTCSEARAHYIGERARKNGIQPRDVSCDAGPARQLILTLMSQGYSLRSIAKLANCGKSTISSIANSTAKRVSAHTLQRIQSVPLSLGISRDLSGD